MYRQTESQNFVLRFRRAAGVDSASACSSRLEATARSVGWPNVLSEKIVEQLLTTESAALYPYTVNLQSKVRGVGDKDLDMLAPLRSAKKPTRGTREN